MWLYTFLHYHTLKVCFMTPCQGQRADQHIQLRSDALMTECLAGQRQGVIDAEQGIRSIFRLKGGLPVRRCLLVPGPL